MGAIAVVASARSTKCLLHAESINTKVTATVMTAITTPVVISMAVTVALRVWEVPSRRITAKSASAWTRSRSNGGKKDHQHIQLKLLILRVIFFDPLHPQIFNVFFLLEF